MMKLYLISQEFNIGYDTHDSAVVSANNAEEAQKIEVGDIGPYGSWAKPEFVSVEYLGEAKAGTEVGIILSSFNAG